MWWGLRLLVFFVFSLLLATLLSIIFKLIQDRRSTPHTAEAKVTITGKEFTPAVLIVSFLMVTQIDRRHLASLGFHFYPSWWGELGLGIVIGCIMIGLTALLFRLFSGISPIKAPSNVDLFEVFSHFRGVIGEELLIRGYPFQTLISSLGVYPAVGITSAFFGLLHYQSLGWLGAVTTTSSGLLLALAVLKTKSLWLAVGIHFGWNFLEATLRLKAEPVRWRYLAEVIIIGIFLLLLFWLPLHPYPEMEQLWNEYIHSDT